MNKNDIKLLNEYKKTLNIYIKNSILKPYLFHVEFELENIHTKIKTDKYLQQLLTINGYDLRSFELSIINAIQKITELQNLFREFDI